MRRPLYSERKAIARMGPGRRRLHWVLRRVYHAVYDRLPWESRPAAVVRRVWGLYRRTWPTEKPMRFISAVIPINLEMAQMEYDDAHGLAAAAPGSIPAFALRQMDANARVLGLVMDEHEHPRDATDEWLASPEDVTLLTGAPRAGATDPR